MVLNLYTGWLAYGMNWWDHTSHGLGWEELLQYREQFHYRQRGLLATSWTPGHLSTGLWCASLHSLVPHLKARDGEVSWSRPGPVAPVGRGSWVGGLGSGRSSLTSLYSGRALCQPSSSGLIFIQLPLGAEKRAWLMACSGHVSTMFYCFNCTYERHLECSLAFLTAPDTGCL